MNYFRTGDIVRWVDGTIYKVTKVNPKNLVCVGSDGRLVSFRASHAQPADRADWVEPVLELQEFQPGTVVRFRPETGKTGIWVVAKKKSAEEYELVKLGGSTRYYPRASGRMLIPVDAINLANWDGAV